MRNFIIYLFVLLISNIYAQCDDYGQSQCSNDNNCEWVENIETEWCSENNQTECYAQEECYWYLGAFYQCAGGSYEVDNGYCQENEMLECSEMNELECISDDSCDWTENIETGWCSGLGSSAACAEYSNYGCSWEFVYWCGYSSCFECTGGTYSYDNSYCEEVEVLDCSSLNHGPCMSNSECEWVEEMETGNCSDINNGSECYATNQCSWYNAGNYGYLYDNCYGGTYTYDNSYCEEIEYISGDINGDSLINVLDVIQIVNLILESEYSQVVDMNYDGNVNVLDVVLVVEIILGN